MQLKKINNFLNKYRNKKIVLCHGVFDVFHYGHLEYLKYSKNLGDKLVVSLTSDKFVKKGPNRPVFNQMKRSKIIESLKFVDLVLINNFETPIKLIKKLKPNYYCKGSDYKNLNFDLTKNINREKKVVMKSGGKFIITKTKLYSSSNLINKHFQKFSFEQRKIIKLLKTKNNKKTIHKIFDKLSKKNIIVIKNEKKKILINTIGNFLNKIYQFKFPKKNRLDKNQIYQKKIRYESILVDRDEDGLALFKNLGFNNLNKISQTFFENAEYFCISQKKFENKINCKKNFRLKTKIKNFCFKNDIKKICVKLKKEGWLFYNLKENKFIFCPPFSKSSNNDKELMKYFFYISSAIQLIKNSDILSQLFSSYFVNFYIKKNKPSMNINQNEIIKSFLNITK